MAVKIRLKRLGKLRTPHYRIVVADSRKKRDGRVIEEIGRYIPTENPSFIEVNSERAQYWLGVGAQPTEPVMVLLKITGDWQKFKGLPGAEGTLRVKEAKVTKNDIFAQTVASVANEPRVPTIRPKAVVEEVKVAEVAAVSDAPVEAAEVIVASEEVAVEAPVETAEAAADVAAETPAEVTEEA